MERDALFTPISEFSEEQTFIQDELEDFDEAGDNVHAINTATFEETVENENESPKNIPDLLKSKHVHSPRPSELSLRPTSKQSELTKKNIGIRPSSDKTSRTREEGSSSANSGRITCGICLEDQHMPKLLPCMHSFCRHCLQQHIDSSSSQGVFSCPLCRREIREPKNGANGFEDNIYNDFNRKQQIKCQACIEREVTTKCLECRQNYCQNCARIHLNMANSKDHHLSSLDNEGLEANLTPKIFCKIHRNKKLSYFCRDCGAVLCGKCVIETHARHTCLDVATVAHAFRQELRSNLDSNDMGWGFVSTLEDRYFEIKRARSAFQNDAAEEILKIENQAEKMKEKIDKAARIMVDSLCDRERHITLRYDLAVDESETKLKWARNTLQTISQIVEVSGDAELISRFVHMKDVLNDIKERVTLTSYDGYDVKFTRGIPTTKDLNAILGDFEIRGPSIWRKSKILEFPLPRLQPPTIIAICPVSDTESWVFYENIVQIVDKNGLRGKPIQIDDDVIDATVYMGKTVVIACPRKLICLTEELIQDELFTISQRPSGIVVVQEHIVIVSKDYSSINVYTIDGKYIRDINKNGGTKLIRQPCKVTTNDQREIFVSDNVSKRIAIFDIEGTLRLTFEVTGIVPSVLQFDTHGNNLLVADEEQNVHLFSSQGQYLQTVFISQQDKIGNISCIAVDFGRDIWVGNADGRIYVFFSLEKL